MKESITFEKRIEDERSARVASENVKAFLTSRCKGMTVEISIRKKVKRRSNQANRFYWGVAVKEVTRMFREAGNDVDAEDVHEFLKEHVGKLSRVLVTPDGEVLKMPGSTKRLTTMEFMDYIERIRAWSAEMGLLLPLPNESPPEFNPLEGEYQNGHP